MATKVKIMFIFLILVIYSLKQGISGNVRSKCHLSENERKPKGKSGMFRINTLKEFPKTCTWETQFNASSGYSLRICGLCVNVKYNVTDCHLTPKADPGCDDDSFCFVFTTGCFSSSHVGVVDRIKVSSLPKNISLTMYEYIDIEAINYSYSKCDTEGPTSPKTHWTDTATNAYNMTTHTHTSQGKNASLGTILPIVIAVVVAVLLGGLLFVWCRFRKKIQNLSAKSTPSPERTDGENTMTENVIYESSFPHTNDNEPAAMLVDNIIYGQTVV
uniref:uncharacterized protein LOC120345380 n=1 Tax=Styela clava TaxID=7725 RepID=UPI00193AA3D4|nr:uncharacterized protein LOC120345380 [Styela clava]